MSGLEVIGAISAVITLLEASIKIYDSARHDIKLSETFEVVRRRLPVILHILQTCKNHLELRKDYMPSHAREALENILIACDEKARKLRETFEMVIPGENDKWKKRYAKVVRRLGNGNKVEELMSTLAQDVQLIVNNHAVNSSTLEQNVELEDIVRAMKFVKISTNVINGSGQQIDDNAHIGTQNFILKEDFSFRGPVGIHLGHAPYIASELFIGRGSELDEFTEALHPPDRKAQKQQRLVLGGMGGIGKTQLAIAYAESTREFYSSVFWLNAASEAALKESLQSIASLIFDVQELGVLGDKEVMRRVHQWLSDPNNTRWLLIFDNYDDADQFQIDYYYPPASHGSIIVTTRQPDLVAGNNLHIKPLDNIEESLTILQTRSKRENTQSDPYAKRLVERLSGLPLALATVGTYLQRSALTFERYLQEYEERWNLDLHPAKLQEYQERTLYTSWDLSYNRLEKENPDAAKFLKLLAYFSNQSLWYELFQAGLADSSPEWLRQVVADDVKFDGVMRTLTENNFLEVQPALESWSMHNCVHDWIAVLNKDIDTQRYWYAFGCVDASISVVNEHSFKHVSYSRLAAHATQLAQQRFLRHDLIFSSMPMPGRLNMVSRISRLLRDQIQLVTAEKMLQWVLAGKEKALGIDHMSTLDTVNDLGTLYRDQGKLDKAGQMFQRALAGREKALGGEHTSTLDTINDLGILYHDQGRLDEAEQMLQRALVGREKTLGADHISTLNTINDVGIVYRDQGKIDEAGRMFQRALAGKEKALGVEHMLTLTTVHNPRLLYKDKGKLDEE